MRGVLIFLIILISFNAISQNVVKGFVYDTGGSELPGVVIIETGTHNRTETNINGYFEFITINDASHLSFSWIGHKTKSVKVTSDTTLYIVLNEYFHNTRWLTFGANYDFFNSVIGLQISNGVDEEPLIHFEDFQDNILIKIHGQSDLGNNYSYGGEIGINFLRYIGRTTLKYDVLNFEDSQLFLNDFNLTSRIRYIRNTGLIFRTGFQELNKQKNFGLGLGFEQVAQNVYIGFNSRYYFDYFHHQAYLQFRALAKHFISFQTVYNRIDKKNMLSVGLNYSFVRNKNR